MAINPMQRKARNSFLLGMLLMLVIAGAVVALLIVQLKNYRDKELEEQRASVNIAVLNQDVKSGQVITVDMLETQTVNRNYIPENAIGDAATLDNGKRGIIKEIVSYNEKTQKYKVIYTDNSIDYIKAKNLRETNPTSLGPLEREYWKARHDDTVPDNIKAYA